MKQVLVLFQSLYMALVIDITDGRSLSNKVCRELLLKKSKVMLSFSFSSNLYITNKTEHFSFESGHDMWVSKLLKDWLIVLQ